MGRWHRIKTVLINWLVRIMGYYAETVLDWACLPNVASRTLYWGIQG